MKLSIQHGVSVEKAMEYIKVFLQEHCENYQILKGDMNVYLNLKDDENRNCPDNEKEFILSADGVTDVEQKRKMEALTWLRKHWEMFVLSKRAIISQLESKIELDEKYLSTAVEKGRTLENIEKRKVAKEKNLMALKGSEERFALIQKLDECVNQGKGILYLREYNGTYINNCLVFEDIDGYTGHFDGIYLRDEFPPGYED